MSSLELVHVPLPRRMNPLHVDPDRLARARARRTVKVLNVDAVILRARRVALRGLPEIATLPCGCNGVNLCPWAAQRYIDMWEGQPALARTAADEFTEHRQALSPRGPSRPRRTDIGLQVAREVLAVTA
ncbi:hypothetical protein [Deinococcus enclensis]|uniref:4Fe-4S ferredoxin-type domain-containing protein n=1 Tax=Deinococcus enclensis TaxID=1049582 RepID=A0ABT9ME65_9DEIO|nr:hypothetical protein [Deinococcus enclensis]MDP9764900.1 hypothetical protein [Deinococcus enclensis]